MRKAFILLALCTVQLVFGQEQKSRGDRFYEKNDFTGAIKYYEASLDDGLSKQSMERLANSYYNVSDYNKTERTLRLLLNGRYTDPVKEYDNSANFRMFEVLLAQGKQEEALTYLEKYEVGQGNSFDKEATLKKLQNLTDSKPSFTIRESNLNSESNEFGAVKVGDSVFFTSDRPSENILKQLFGKRFKWTRKAFLDIYSVRVKSNNDTIGNVKALSTVINTNLHDGNFCFSKDGDVMYLSRSNYDEGKKVFNEDKSNLVQLYKTVKIDGKWREAEKLSFVKDGYTYQHPALTPDGKRLYFSSDIEGGYGSYDIYYVQVFNDGSFSAPVNAGEVINTPNREQFPFVSDRGDIYFSSNGHLGLGLLDVFVSPLSVKGYLTPTNLGAPINSPYDDFSLTYYNGTDGFVASNRNKMNDQVYSFVQTDKIIEREFDIKFEIRDVDTRKLITNANIKILGYEEKQVYSNTTRGEGVFKTKLPVDDYTFIASGENYKESRDPIEVQPENGQVFTIYLKQIFTDSELAIINQKNIDKDLKEKDPSRFELLTDQQAPQVVEKDGKLFIDVAPIYFDFDLWDIREDSQTVLDELANKLTKYKRIRIKIRSHTDSRGPDAYNIPLSERRAKSTFEYLVAKGIDPSRVEYQGYGDTQPVIKCPAGVCDEEQHQLNRRSEFEITGY